MEEIIKWQQIQQQRLQQIIDSPLRPGVDGKRFKSFDELVEEKIREDPSEKKNDKKEVVKKPFLKKGTGSKRFQLINQEEKMKTTKKNWKEPVMKNRKVHKVVLPVVETKIQRKKPEVKIKKNWIEDEEEKEDAEDIEGLKKVLELIREKKEETRRQEEVRRQEEMQKREAPFGASLRREIAALEQRLNAIQCSCKQREVSMDYLKKVDDELSVLDKKFSALERKVNILEKRKPIANNVRKSKRVQFENGDEMTVREDDAVVYKFASDGTKQTTFKDGSRLIEFPSGQTEHIEANGSKHICYPNGVRRTVYHDGSEEQTSPDGTIVRIAVDGTETIECVNGEKETRTKYFTKREFKDGSVKFVYADGREETYFSDGRVRTKLRHH